MLVCDMQYSLRNRIGSFAAGSILLFGSMLSACGGNDNGYVDDQRWPGNIPKGHHLRYSDYTWRTEVTVDGSFLGIDSDLMHLFYSDKKPFENKPPHALQFCFDAPVVYKDENMKVEALGPGFCKTFSLLNADVESVEYFPQR